MTTNLSEQCQQLGTTVGLACVGAASALEDKSSGVKKNKKLIDSLKLLQSRLLFLKAKDEYVTKAKDISSADLAPHDQIRADLNKAITTAKLKELVCETAKESVVFGQFMTDVTETSDGNRERVRLELAETYQEHHARMEKFNALVKKRSEEFTRVSKLRDELCNLRREYRKMISTKRQELNSKEVQVNTVSSSVEERLCKKVGHINVSRMVIVNILGVSGVNFMKHPEWADMIVKCRKPVTVENIDAY